MNTLKRIWVCALTLASFSLAGLLGNVDAQAADIITYYHNDISGTPLLATDAAGNVLWKENYQPYGDKLNKQPASAGNKVGFAGKPYDGNTGLSYMGARYYDPVIGRFMGIDPKGFDEGNLHSFNRYTYANNNPYKFVDPDGRSPFLIVPIVAGWMGGGMVVGGSVNAAGQLIMTGQVRMGGLGGVVDAMGDGAMLGPLFAGVAGRAVSTEVAAAKEVSTVSKEVLGRKAPGADGAKSIQIIERENGTMISRTHEVIKDSKVIHQHQNHTGKHGGERQFPDEWTGTKTINAPYENIPPSLSADRVPGGRTF